MWRNSTSSSIELTRTLQNVIDDFNREPLGIEVDLSLSAARAARVLNQIIEHRGRPLTIRCDNGPEYAGSTLLAWAQKRGIKLAFIQPGKPQQNAYIEHFNRTARYEWLSQYEWEELAHVQDHTTRWMWSYNHERPNMALGGLTPKKGWPWPHQSLLLRPSKKGALPPSPRKKRRIDTTLANIHPKFVVLRGGEPSAQAHRYVSTRPR